MLSVNSNQTNAMTFKDKPSAKDMKKAYKAMEEAHWHAIMSDSRISKEVKMNLLRNECVSRLSSMSWFEKLKLCLKGLFK